MSLKFDITHPNSPLRSIFGPKIVEQSNKSACSYCGKEVGEFEATHGTGPLRIKTETIIHEVNTSDGKVMIPEEVTKFNSARVIACPAHAHLIAPDVRYWCHLCKLFSWTKHCKECGMPTEVSAVKSRTKFPSLEERR